MYLKLALIALLFPMPAWALSTGDAMPMKDAPLHNVDGKDVTLGTIAGAKGTLVVFTCNHCPYAMAWEDRIVALGNEYEKKGIGVIAINSNDPAVAPGDAYEPMQTRAKEKGFAFPYAVDSTSAVAKAFGASHTPEVYVFDAAGKLVYHGAVDDNSEDAAAVDKHYLRDTLAAVVEGRPVSPAETKAIGCSIKFR